MKLYPQKKSLRGALSVIASGQRPRGNPGTATSSCEAGLLAAGSAIPWDCFAPLAMTSAALLVIDMQRYFLDPQADAFLKSGPGIVKNVKKIISKFRKCGLPIVHTRHAHKKGEPAGQMTRWWRGELPLEGEPQSELIDELKPRAGETVITKTRYSAFERTMLGPYLKGNNVETVVICGVMTHLCVETTARHAFMLDFQPVVVSDACATQTEEHHKASLLNLAHGFAYVVNAQEIISVLEKENSKNQIRPPQNIGGRPPKNCGGRNPKQIQNPKFK